MIESNQPYISIIIPTYRRPRHLAGCLHSLSCLDYPRDCFEVIVVDDGSHAPPAGVVADFHEHLDVMLLTQKHAGPATARNTGAAKAKGEVLAFTDDDCEPATDWLRLLAKRLAATPNCAVGGLVINKLSDNPFSTTSQMLIDYLYAYYNADPDRAHFLATNNLALPADLFHGVGGFDAKFSRAAGEDREFCERWINQGYRMIYAPEVLIFHAHSLTARTFIRQQFNYGVGAFLFHKKCSCQTNRLRKLQKPLSFYVNLLRYPFSIAQSQKRFTLAMLLLLSQLGTAAGYFRGRVERNQTI